ncbi:ribosome biogenesis GTP-binding protein YihA/YsxC [Portibacter lacus]|uniref:Probable GTP-binding protein EngB n=1 Tax=Portibacter lacus TaxID=1099794 RepID=A0AA37SPM7_9BACT|nr:ribosome biogenesis GTP-binding protein YihA/YsxC [Portibacter lacus]GLR16506.1 putative GTP-binding protein EngB [Portibacter lacus]
MNIKTLEFVGSFPSETACPDSTFPEYAFIGRSNVGKSSLINLITDRKEIAKVSSTPGKTQLINFFEVNESWHLVDLPGYGYAKVSKKNRAKFSKMIDHYLLSRKQLQCAFVLIDARIPLQEIDREFISKLGASGVPFVLVFTKIDGVKLGKLTDNLRDIKEKLLEEWTELPQTFITSSTKRKGREEILELISKLNKAYMQ